jgi:hypothetical protein
VKYNNAEKKHPQHQTIEEFESLELNNKRKLPRMRAPNVPHNKQDMPKPTMPSRVIIGYSIS